MLFECALPLEWFTATFTRAGAVTVMKLLVARAVIVAGKPFPTSWQPAPEWFFLVM